MPVPDHTGASCCHQGVPGSCHGPGSPTRRSDGRGLQIALLGLPNTGKSTLFNRLTGGHAQIANWPGLTVELLRGPLPADHNGTAYELVDLPGIHDLSGSSEDEAVVQRYMQGTPPDLVIVVLNASQISGQLGLLLQMRQLGLPVVAALNMSDEARRHGMTIDHLGLSGDLGLPVLPVSAKRNQGIGALIDALHRWGEVPRPAGPAGGPLPLQPADVDTWQQELVAHHVTLPEGLQLQRTRLADRWLLHPVLGVVLFLAIVMGVFQLLYAASTPLQDLLGSGLDWIRLAWLEPGLRGLGSPDWLRSFLLDGLWLGVSTVATFLPLIFLFYVLIGIIEDSGYLPRAAFLMDGFMRWLGLDGRAFVLQVMGFGCNVPSIMGTRVIRDRSLRLLAMLCIPFALCQARLTVFIFLAGVFFPRPWWAPGLVLFGFYGMSFAAAVITGLVFKRAFPGDGAFVLELPPYRAPSLGTILRRGWTSMLNFMVTTRVFILVGAAAIWLLTHLPPGAGGGSGPSLASGIGQLFQPLLGPIGMNPELTVSLFFGFIAKEILLGAMAVIYGTNESGLGGAIQGVITPLQSLSFMTFVLLYTPCLGTVAAQIQESRSRIFALLSLSWSLLLAWLMALIVYQGGSLILALR
ncbi:ferrous iron transport protein B [Cyanobium sp. N.Huapi 1H5]|uniref:ferrous iron transport protein B n=1 Tax=Cyanobium sp. N.Huapi 1H5 TaxID=2823719 RepID=UPI0020CE64DD|nr:ferrous iron transport protein B [Cyanobium sp. N.Huapi 1H5]MCP9836619.1 ferrous iron transport protein B [Cyanobium sp. N.Huapi 1H5]